MFQQGVGSHAKCLLPPLGVQCSLWWMQMINLYCSFTPQSLTAVVATNTHFCVGWGHIVGLMVKAVCSWVEPRLLIHSPELLAITRVFRFSFWSHNIQVASDSVLHKQANWRWFKDSPALTLELWNWCVPNVIIPVVIYIAVKETDPADHLNHTSLLWQVDPCAFHYLFLY